ncbi:MAG: cytochrome b/b6 domain-containing protein [Paracoccus sp.]|nr:cytochrome b/b6 domain-containing protein [Paracoccus sp. (in: a-proteobacteria)]
MRNTTRAYGWAARAFHWTVAVLILTALGLGLYADSLPRGGEDQLQAIFAAFSIHKTAGVAVLIIASARILWTLCQIRPRPLHPERRLETLLAETVHWALWIGMIIMPLSGWLLHSAAPGGFSRILWPLGQRLPMVPEDAALAEGFARFHEAGWWVLGGLIALHVAGALKHALIDRDHTFARMAGNPDRLPEPPAHQMSPGLQHLLAACAAVAIWGGLVAVTGQAEAEAEPAATATASQTAAASGWAVQQGTLDIQVKQGGNDVAGQFAKWQAAIDYAPETQTGRIDVTIDIASLTLGSVTGTATGPDFLNAAAHPTASFKAEILPPAAEGQPHTARGTLTIAGKSTEAELPFALTLAEDTATASGTMQVDRRDFGIGAGYADESTVGFAVAISFDLTAARQK